MLTYLKLKHLLIKLALALLEFVIRLSLGWYKVDRWIGARITRVSHGVQRRFHVTSYWQAQQLVVLAYGVLIVAPFVRPDPPTLALPDSAIQLLVRTIPMSVLLLWAFGVFCLFVWEGFNDWRALGRADREFHADSSTVPVFRMFWMGSSDQDRRSKSLLRVVNFLLQLFLIDPYVALAFLLLAFVSGVTPLPPSSLRSRKRALGFTPAPVPVPTER